MHDNAIARLVRAGRPATAAVALIGLAGCTMGGLFGGSDSAQYVNSSASPAEIAKAAPDALPAIATTCPPVKVVPSAATIQSYGGVRTTDPERLHYQVVFEKTSRSCIVSNGLISAKIGVLGRVILGPAGSESKVDVPLRVEVDRDGAPVFSERYVLPVAMTSAAGGAEFVKVIDKVQIPYVGGEDIVIWVGFDQKA